MIITIAIFIVSFTTLHIYATVETINSNTIQTKKDFNIAVASDWGCGKDAKKTVENIQEKNPEVVIAGGDLSYDKSANCWFDIIKPFMSKMKIAMGDHEYHDTKGGKEGVMNDYLKPLNLAKTYYSFDFNNVSIILHNSNFHLCLSNYILILLYVLK